MVETERRNPDELLADVQREEARARRGRLRVFFGASAGVGKTYSMLEAARAATRRRRRTSWSATSSRTGASRPSACSKGWSSCRFSRSATAASSRREFDLDAALRARPATVLVDELAHSNIAEGEPRPRHAKRWQDVEELLDAGINVWTTLNVQHLESLNDVVAGITGIRQQETLPDRIFDEADEVELIDLPPDDLLARLKAGQGVRRRTRWARPPSGSSASRICWRCANSRCAAPPTASTRRRCEFAGAGAHLAAVARARPVPDRGGAGRTRRSSWCASASASPMRSMPSGWWCRSRRRSC